MSQNPNEALDQRVRQLEQLVSAQEAHATRRRKTTLVAGVVLVVVCVVALSSLTSLASRLDAHALTQIGRQQIEKHLPAGRASFSEFLITESPHVVRGGIDALLGLLPEARQALVADIDARIQVASDIFEAEIGTQLETSVAASKQLIDERFPTLDNRQKIEKLVEIVTDDFVRNVDIALDAIYPDYVAEMERIDSFLDDLTEYDDAKLTSKEATQREIIRTMLRLMVLERSRTKSS